VTRHILSIALVATAALALAACTSAPGASPSSSGSHATPTPTATPASSLEIATRVVTQEGLAIALASNVLQTQLLLVSVATADGPASCTALPGGGSHRTTAWSGPDSAKQVTEVVYYDASCGAPYTTASATVDAADTDSATAKVDYLGKDGKPLGTLTTQAHADTNSLNLEGLGTFTPADTSVAPASLGLACHLEDGSEDVLDCQGGITQNLPSLKLSVGSITPLTLSLGSELTDPITFTGSGNSTATGALGALSIVSPDNTNLAIQGASPVAGSITTTGQAHGFGPFPTTPTGWTVADATDDVTFSITLVDDTSRTLTGTVVQTSTKKPLATLQLDQSGTGTVTFGTAAPTPVVSWLLSR
jgi:hypothetical protein